MHHQTGKNTRKLILIFADLCNNGYFCNSKKINMKGDLTFTMIKPEAVAEGNTGPIISMIEKAGFNIVAMKLTRLSMDQAGKFYAVHKERPFYSSLCEYMSSGKIVAMVIKKENAIEDYRKLIGATDPAKADEGTIRKLFAK